LRNGDHDKAVAVLLSVSRHTSIVWGHAGVSSVGYK
jgi:hypothetical protein